MTCEFPTTVTICRDGGMRRCAGRRTPGMPDFPGLQRIGDRFGFRSGFRPLRQSGIPSKRIEEASTFDIAGHAGRGRVVLSALTATALARKCKHPKGLKCHYTFGIRALYPNGIRLLGRRTLRQSLKSPSHSMHAIRHKAPTLFAFRHEI